MLHSIHWWSIKGYQWHGILWHTEPLIWHQGSNKLVKWSHFAKYTMSLKNLALWNDVRYCHFFLFRVLPVANRTNKGPSHAVIITQPATFLSTDFAKNWRSSLGIYSLAATSATVWETVVKYNDPFTSLWYFLIPILSTLITLLKFITTYVLAYIW